MDSIVNYDSIIEEFGRGVYELNAIPYARMR